MLYYPFAQDKAHHQDPPSLDDGPEGAGLAPHLVQLLQLHLLLVVLVVGVADQFPATVAAVASGGHGLLAQVSLLGVLPVVWRHSLVVPAPHPPVLVLLLLLLLLLLLVLGAQVQSQVQGLLLGECHQGFRVLLLSPHSLACPFSFSGP